MSIRIKFQICMHLMYSFDFIHILPSIVVDFHLNVVRLFDFNHQYQSSANSFA